jgi:L-threonylcarbamoyladenylate synthase
VAVIASRRVEADHFIPLPSEPALVARQLFRWLRELDERGADYVLIESVSRSGLGRAIMDRLERAATRVRHAGRTPAPLEAT